MLRTPDLFSVTCVDVAPAIGAGPSHWGRPVVLARSGREKRQACIRPPRFLLAPSQLSRSSLRRADIGGTRLFRVMRQCLSILFLYPPRLLFCWTSASHFLVPRPKSCEIPSTGSFIYLISHVPRHAAAPPSRATCASGGLSPAAATACFVDAYMMLAVSLHTFVLTLSPAVLDRGVLYLLGSKQVGVV